MPKYSVPGVYVDVVPSGGRSIARVATSITAFVGSALRGEENEPARVQSLAEYTRTFGELSEAHPMGFSVEQFFQNGGRDALIVRVSNGGVAATGSADTLNLTAASTGTWGNRLSITITHPDPSDDPKAAENEAFNLTITDNGLGTVETFSDISTRADSARFATTVIAQQSKLVRINGPLAASRPKPVADVPFNTDGNDGIRISDSHVSDPALEKRSEGIWSLQKADLFNLLCIPPFSLDASGDIGAQTRSAAAAYCLLRRAMFIADPLHDWRTSKDITDPATGVDSAVWGLDRNENTALYFPRIVQPNPLQEGSLTEFAPCGAIAGVIARTDTTRGIWKAPAGLEATLQGVLSLTATVTDHDNDLLNALAVNALRAFPAQGHVVWGARTLVGSDQLASEWKYVPVRRTALYIQETLYRSTQWAVFEPNNERLWAKLRQNVDAFMQILFRQGAFQGRSASDAYFVKCDAETTTQADINLGVVTVLVGIAAVKPAEFVVFKITQKAEQGDA
jgi:phage tail sheath protein FI